MLIPQDDVLMLFFRKLEHSDAFSSFLEKFSGDDFEKMCENFQVSIEKCGRVENPLTYIR